MKVFSVIRSCSNLCQHVRSAKRNSLYPTVLATCFVYNFPPTLCPLGISSPRQEGYSGCSSNAGHRSALSVQFKVYLVRKDRGSNIR